MSGYDVITSMPEQAAVYKMPLHVLSQLVNKPNCHPFDHSAMAKGFEHTVPFKPYNDGLMLNTIGVHQA